MGSGATGAQGGRPSHEGRGLKLKFASDHSPEIRRPSHEGRGLKPYGDVVHLRRNFNVAPRMRGVG